MGRDKDQSEQIRNNSKTHVMRYLLKITHKKQQNSCDDIIIKANKYENTAKLMG